MFGKTRASLGSLLLIASFLFFTAEIRPSNAEEPCVEHGYNGKDVVEVPVRFQFENPPFQVSWVYSGLNPKLEVQREDYESSGRGQRIENGSLVSFFCIYITPGKKHIANFKVTYGDRDIVVAPRVVDWDHKQEVSSGMEGYPSHSLFIMQEISLLRLPDPNWAILKSATLNRDSNGVELLDVEVYNPTETDLPGGELTISSDPGIVCVAAGPTFEIPVSLSQSRCVSKSWPAKEANETENFGSCVIGVTAPDPGGGRALMRQADAGLAGCGEYYADMGVGPTGMLQKETITKLRYVFGSHGPSLIDVLRGNIPAVPAASRTRTKYNELLVKVDGAVYPHRETITLGAGVQ